MARARNAAATGEEILLDRSFGMGVPLVVMRKSESEMRVKMPIPISRN
jgi:hypothetical protein